MSCEFCPAAGGGCIVCAMVGTPAGGDPLATMAADPDQSDRFVLSIPGTCRARVYGAGGIGYDAWVPGIGWVLDDNPDSEFERIVWAARRQAYPRLGDVTG